MHPSLKLEWYEELLRDLQARYPTGQPARLQPAGNLALPQAQQAAAARRCCGASRTPASAACPAAAARSSSTASARRSPVNKVPDRRMARSASRLARTRRPVDLHDDVRPRRDAGRAHRAPGPAAAACRTRRAASRRSSAGRCSRAHRMADVAAGRGVRVPADAGHRPALPRQHPEHPVVVGDAGGEDRPGGAVLRGQRHGQPDDRGERRRVGRDGPLPDAGADQGGDPRGRATCRGSGTCSTS